MSIKSYILRGLQYIIKGTPVYEIKVSVSYSRPHHRLDGKKILVTGGGHGLGLAMARKFVDEGASVIIAGRDESVLESSSNTIGCSFQRLDLQDVASLESFISQVWESLGGIDCLVNNAGVSLHEHSFLDVGIDDFDTQFGTNLRGTYFLTQYFLAKYLKGKKRGGSILFVSSERGMMVDDLPYGISKAAINSFAQGLAVNYIKEGIRVNVIAPGVTASDMTGVRSDGNLYRESQMTKRVYLPEEVAESACFLLSDDSMLINGQILVCNEGKSINFKR